MTITIIPANNYVTNFALNFLRCAPPFGADAPLALRGSSCPPEGESFKKGLMSRIELPLE